MSPRALRASLAVIFAAGLLCLAPAKLRAAGTEASGPPGVAPDAVAAIGRMSKSLQAPQLSFEAKVFRAYAGSNGELLHIFHDSKIIVRRPDRFSVDTSGDDGAMKMLYDGADLVIFSPEHKQYVKIPVTGSIDKALDAATERFHTDFPLADLLGADPEKSVLSGVTAGGQVGVATIGGVQCRHFFLDQGADDLDVELWLEDNDKALPRRIVVTYRALPGRPNFIADLSNWNLSAQPSDDSFKFTPPAGVSQVDLSGKPPASPPK